MKNYEFTIRIAAIGDTPEEAWEEAVAGFIQEPGAMPEAPDIAVLDEDVGGDEYDDSFPACHICGRRKDGAACSRCNQWTCDNEIMLNQDEVSVCMSCWTHDDARLLP